MAILLDGSWSFQEGISWAAESHVINNRVQGLEWNSLEQLKPKMCLGDSHVLAFFFFFFSAVPCVWNAPSGNLCPASLISYLAYSSFKA